MVEFNLFGEPIQKKTPQKREKSGSAYRTISEVADQLGLATHVLRFWESKFPQIQPVKRGGGRRLYRPQDIEVIEKIQTLLHDKGYTIRGVQSLFKEKGAVDVALDSSVVSVKVSESEGFDDMQDLILEELIEIRRLLD